MNQQQFELYLAQARAEERDRIREIVLCEEAEDRSLLAQTLALTTDLDPATARKVLSSSLKARTSTPAVPRLFSQVMATVKNPVVGTGDQSDDDQVEREVRRILDAGSANAEDEEQ